MASPAEELSRFIAEAFPGASLPPPRFEALPFLRFELGGEIGTRRVSQRRRRVEQAVSRAAAIFEEAIPTGHRGWFDAYLIRSWLDIVGAYDETLDYLPPTDFGWRIADDAHLRQLLPAAAQADVGVSEVADFWGEGEGNEDEWLSPRRLTVAVELRAIDYRSLFRLIANSEMGLEPSVGSKVYLVDETNPLVVSMYDDRGAFLIAAEPDRLRTLYERHGDWLVDHYRALMDAQFVR